jgi:Carbamoylphosphate synthase large subunit (split gene in MJ)
MSAQKVVIIGHSYSSRLGLIRSSAMAGCEVSVVVMVGGGKKRSRPIDCFSQYVKHYYFCRRKKDDELIRLLLEKCKDDDQKVILIPDSDETAAAIDSNRDVLKEHFLFPHIVERKGTVRDWMDKSRQKQLAEEVGLNVASASIVEIKEGRYTIPSNISYPCFTKPLLTLNGGKGGMRRCDNETELCSALDYIVKYRSGDEKVLVEDYLEIEKEFALVGFSDGENVAIPGLFQLLVISKNSPGIALQGRVLPIDGDEIIGLFKDFVRKMGFVGLFDIDFFFCKGKFFFGEMNLRFGGSGYAITKMGVNLPQMMIESFNGGHNGLLDNRIEGTALYTNDRMCLDDWKAGHFSYKAFRGYLNTSDFRFVPDKIDKRPERAFEIEIFKQRVIRIVKRFLR